MPVSAVYEDCQAYEGGSSVGVECVEGGAYGAAGVEDVVNEDYGFAFNAMVGMMLSPAVSGEVVPPVRWSSR